MAGTFRELIKICHCVTQFKWLFCLGEIKIWVLWILLTLIFDKTGNHQVGIMCSFVSGKTHAHWLGVFAAVVSGFASFLSEYFASVLESAVLSMLIGWNNLSVLIPIAMGFSLLPFKNFNNIGLVLWHSYKNRDGFSGHCGRGGVLLENDKRSWLLASGISFIDGEHHLKVEHLAVV